MEPNSKPLWDNGEYKPLRLPNSLVQRQNVTVDVNTSTTSHNNIEKQNLSKMEEIVANSSLKVDAPVFIPRFSESKAQVSSAKGVQNRLKIHKPESDFKASEEVENNSKYSKNPMDTESDLKRIRQIISTLTKDPGQFDNLVQIIMDTVMPYLEDHILLPEIVEILVNRVRAV